MCVFGLYLREARTRDDNLSWAWEADALPTELLPQMCVFGLDLREARTRDEHRQRRVCIAKLGIFSVDSKKRAVILTKKAADGFFLLILRYIVSRYVLYRVGKHKNFQP